MKLFVRRACADLTAQGERQPDHDPLDLLRGDERRDLLEPRPGTGVEHDPVRPRQRPAGVGKRGARR